MDLIFTYTLYLSALGLFILSFVKDKTKTRQALKKAWKMFINVLPQFLAILLLVSLLLTVLEAGTIQRIIGSKSGISGMLISSLVGAIALVPVLIAFPIVSELIRNGAGIVQMAVFLSTLTTVGIITIPLEIRYLGKKAAVLRNVLAFLFSFAVAFAVGMVFA